MQPKVAPGWIDARLTRGGAPVSQATLGRRWSRPWPAGRASWLLIGLFLLALVPRLALLAARSGDLEFWEYETLARNIAAGDGYVIRRFGHLTLAFGDGNLYSFLAGALYALVGHSPTTLGVLQAVLAALAVPVIFALAERPLGARVAALGAVLAALHPGLLAYTLKLHPLGLDVLLLALVVYWSTREHWTRGGALQTGLTLGLNLMTRPTFFLAGLAALSVRWLARRASLRQLVAVTLIGVAIGAPWVARNWLYVGRPLLMSTSLEDVWKGNNPLSSGSGYLAPGESIFDAAPVELRDRIWHADELQLNDMFASETASFIREQPEQFASLFARKFAYFWWFPQAVGVLYPASWLAAYQAYALLMYAFAAVGMVGIVRHGSPAARRLLAMLAAVGLTLAVVHALAYVEGRHRWGLEPLLLLLTARGIFASVGGLRALSAWRHSRVWSRRRQIDQ
jgi:hypothetical protein